jgi:hypothetical protein
MSINIYINSSKTIESDKIISQGKILKDSPTGENYWVRRYNFNFSPGRNHV